MPLGVAVKVWFQNESMPAPPMNGLAATTSIMFILPNSTATLLPKRLTEVEARDVEGVGAVDPRRVERGVRRDQDAGRGR